MQCQRLIVIVKGFVVAPKFIEYIATTKPSFSELGIQCQRLIVIAKGFVVALEFNEYIATANPGLSEVWF